MVLPYSQEFKNLRASGDPSAVIYVLIYAAIVCFTMFFIVRNTNYRGKKLFFHLVLIVFFITSFMMQIETLAFGTAFPALTRIDIVFFMIGALLAILASAFLLVLFFQNKKAVAAEDTAAAKDLAATVKKINIKSALIKLGIIGILYAGVYMFFGYFVAMRFEATRLFYTGSSANNVSVPLALPSQLLLVPFQIFRGILFGVFTLPLVKMINSKTKLIISICLVYLCPGMQLIIPNPLFPDMVRVAHLIEMTSSMLLFGLIVGSILWWEKTLKRGVDL